MQIELFGLFMVGAIWGITNPLLEKGSQEKKTKETDFGVTSLIKSIFLNLRFLVPFIANQLGSGLYYYCMGKTDFSLGPTIANSVSFVVTFIVENLLKKQSFKRNDILGLALVICGVLLCTY